MCEKKLAWERAYQENNRRATDQSHGGGQLPHVSSAVAACRLVHVLHQTQLLDAPLGHLVPTTTAQQVRTSTHMHGSNTKIRNKKYNKYSINESVKH